MSEMYEGVVFCSDERTARSAFESISSELRLRLVRLASEAFGVYRVASRHDNLKQSSVELVAQWMSAAAGRAVALFYDNSCGIKAAFLYSDGRFVREFGDDDSLWVPYSEDGKLVLSSPRFRLCELRPDEEYDCVFSAIDVGLEAVGAGSQVSAALVTQAFCYGEMKLLAESGGQA
jgi:hypothetical protein